VPAKARKAAQTKSGSNVKTFYWVLGGIALIGLAAIAWVALKPGKAATEPIQLTEEQLKDTQGLVRAAHAVTMGPDNAPVRILVFSDFTCPACRHYSTNVEPNLKNEFVSTGKVQLKYYDFPLGGAGEHRWGFLAARAARCVGEQNKFWEFHDALFRNQATWAYSSKSPASSFEGYVTEVGGDVNAFKSCLNSDKFADVVTANHALGQSLYVSGTPALFMNTFQLSDEWKDYGKLKARIERELGVTAPATTTAQ
jgi:protein-disulfide isomerase